MSTYSLSHLSDRTLLHDLAALVARDRANTAALLAHLAEVDARKLYLPAAYPSMYAYCLGELRMSEETACRRIRAARAARDFPAIFAAVAEGRLHLSAVVLLAPVMTAENVDDLLAAAAHKSKSEIERLLAQRFPRPDVPTRLQALASPSSSGHPKELPSLVTVNFEPLASGTPEDPANATVVLSAPVRMDAPVARPRMAPLAPQRFALQVTIDEETHAMLRRAQELLSHEISSHDLAGVLKRVLEIANARLEKRKFAATLDPRRTGRRANPGSRHIPAEIKRAVWRRDGGRCTFVSASGHRCEERRRIEFDHVREFARGGQATVAGLRLRCRAHNQYGAERTYGIEFMRHKRDAARHASAARASAGLSAEPASVANLENSA